MRPVGGSGIVSFELILGSLCGLGITLYAVACYWFYTVPQRYEANRKALDSITKK